MLYLTCPICGNNGDDADFTHGGAAGITRPASIAPETVSDDAQRDYLYMRDNPRGPHHELWRCTHGCGKWFGVERNTLNQQVLQTYDLRAGPKDKT